MKKRITKTKLLRMLTKMVNKSRKDATRAAGGPWSKEHARHWSRYETLLEVRDYINCHRI